MNLLWGLLALSQALASIAAPVDAEPPLLQLTETDFTTSVSNGGLWIVEFFSPYCIHCKRFKKTWTQLVEEKSVSAPLGFSMAQVDCIAQGDVCSEQNIPHYPMISMYFKGEPVANYGGDRSHDDVSQFIDDNIKLYLPEGGLAGYKPPTPPAPSITEPEAVAGAPSSPEAVAAGPPAAEAQVKLAPRTIPNAPGELVTIKSSAVFDELISKGPLFVKMYAPWCGHCKKLAPVWKELAKDMKGVLNVAEIDCEDNKDLCRREAVEGYPMLFFYQNGHKIDYRGPRKFEDLQKWSRKTVAASQGLQKLDVSQLGRVIQSEPSFFVYLHEAGSAGTIEATTLLQNTAIKHATGAPIFETSSPTLYEEFGITSKEPVLLSFKDHIREPAAFFYLSDALSTHLEANHVHDLDRFLMRHRFPSAFELNSVNFQEVMRASVSTVVVITPISKSAPGRPIEETERTLQLAHKAWAARPNVPNAQTLPAAFVWMDLDRWAEWLKDMYGYKYELDSPLRVIIADHKKLVYHDGSGGKPIYMSEADILSALQEYALGKVELKSSEGFTARQVRKIHDIIEAVAEVLAHHYVLAIFTIVGALGSLLWYAQRLSSHDVNVPREKYSLTGRGRRLD